MSKMIFVCRQTAVQGHKINAEYNALDYCENCPNKDRDCDVTPYWVSDSSVPTKTGEEDE